MVSFGRLVSNKSSETKQTVDFSVTETEKKIHSCEKAEPTVSSLSSAGRFDLREARYSLKDLVLSESVRKEIKTFQSRISNHDTIYHEWGFSDVDPGGSTRAVNFYGPPGTGKTMCADALASCLGKMVLEVNYAEIESKYVGETPKNVVMAFNDAKEKGALLFFDEADSILGRRMTNVTQSADHGVNVARAVMLKQLDAFPGVVVFATNLAKNFDGAFVRRILQHIFVGPPDEACRILLWERMVTRRVPGRENLDFSRLAAISDGLTGGVIKNAVLLALSSAANRVGSERSVTMTDLETGVENVRNSQRDVGAASTEWSVVQ